MEIWNYELAIADLQKIQMPAGAELLSVESRRGTLFVWAIVDPLNHNVEREIEIVGTGNPMPDAPRSFIGTVVIDPFVWHVFERLAHKE